MDAPLRYRTQDDTGSTTPVHVVWEITLACNLSCGHCGSRAGSRRPNELTTLECFDIIHQLRDAGTREITLIGGEAYLRKDWLEIAAEITRSGILCGMQTGARGLTRPRVQAAYDAGIRAIGVSIDGPKDMHDRLRGFDGSYDQAMQAIGYIAETGIRPGVNTQINVLSAPYLWEIYGEILKAGAKSWQTQLTVAMGNAVDSAHILLQPYQIIDVIDDLYSIYEDGLLNDFRLLPGNSIGYFGKYEAHWRSITRTAEAWQGCTAGTTTLGLEADGTIKGCPSLSKDSYSGGVSREVSLAEAISNLSGRTVKRDGNPGRGFCKTCYYYEFCQGGCTWVTHSLTGERGDNPYCYYRASKLRKAGLRESIVKTAEAAQTPFAIGKFAILIETLEGKPDSVTIEDDAPKPDHSTHLVICENCEEFIGNNEPVCVHCNTEVRSAAQTRLAHTQEINNLVAEIEMHSRQIQSVIDTIGDR
ncbi:radical SAM additional 4Fe4S-binding SPASM domain [Hoeflea sp. IMCC20628]|uniref:radical SAM/SPASM domain-containing protein n=1 Tax=Hoeflea sp. IMCC20628 TaxID=1620421 RepID=UPI00063BF33E|nr:radical SAM protein [Hoeflea sp. IMCC20628]AKI02186.1 radical SAM additional 4Fe4S-binding SPASM domain [Hoeflea sp. IMCC20628]